MKNKDLIIDDKTFELLERIRITREDSVTNFIETCSIYPADFANFLKSHYFNDEDEEVNKILDEIELYESKSKTQISESQDLKNEIDIDAKESFDNVQTISIEELEKAGVHLGHLSRKWNPKMTPYIFMERNGIHIIDLNKTLERIIASATALRNITKSGRKVLFVGTKTQAKKIIEDKVSKINMPYISERWPGGALTNFATTRKAVRKMASIDKLISTSSWKNLSKRERSQIKRERDKLKKTLGNITEMNKLPAAIFVVDINKEKIAIAEARKLNISIFAMVNTNSDPTLVDYAIPSNDESSESIELIIDIMIEAISKGVIDRQKVNKLQIDSRRSVKFLEKMKKLHMSFRTSLGLERTPPYSRLNLDLDNSTPSTNENISRFTLESDDKNKPVINKGNSFQHDNVD